MNEKLKDDRHAAIGPSYFMKEDLDKEAVERIWKHSVVPYIEECLFGDSDKIGEFESQKANGRGGISRQHARPDDGGASVSVEQNEDA